jgi:chemotaxis protein histidine kinase CheA
MPSSSSSSSQSERGSGGMTIDIRPMIEDVSQVMTKHITSILSGVIGEYTIYKETHDTIMGLPCVRKLQERISELEQHCGGGEGGCGASMSASSMTTTNTGGGSREEEVAQLQSAIADLNRYIHALESKVDMKSAVSSGDGGHIQQQHHHPDEESVRLEIHETDDGDDGEGDDDHCESNVETSSTHKNVIITTEALEETETEAEEPEDADAEAAEQDAEADAEAEEEEAEQEEAEAEPEQEEAEADAEAAEQEEAEEEAEGEDAEDAEADAEAAEDAEAQPEPEAEEAEVEADAEAEDAEADAEAEEVEEVKIKGKTYFTTNPQNGIIYACVDDDVGDEVGVFKNGVAVFNKGKK